MKKIVLTSGGTTGHVTPNLVLIPSLREVGYEISYIGSYQGMEHKFTENADIPCNDISSGRLRRYFGTRNFSGPFRMIKGYGEALRLSGRYKPNMIFSKDGFVAVPVVLTAKHYKIPTVIHESDMTPGLANKIYIPSAVKVCCNFPETLEYLPEDKTVLAGSPIHKELLRGDRLSGLSYAHLDADKPIFLIIGGSLGSVAVNQAVRSTLPRLLADYRVVHICGKNNLDESLIGTAGYVQYEYVGAPLKHLFATADIVISGAGANSICELLALRKPDLLTPLSASANRGDQILSANSFAKQGFNKVLEEEAISDNTLYQAVDDLYHQRSTYIQAIELSSLNNAVETITSLIESCVKSS